jgi:phosphohistidine phosphatase SixA
VTRGLHGVAFVIDYHLRQRFASGSDNAARRPKAAHNPSLRRLSGGILGGQISPPATSKIMKQHYTHCSKRAQSVILCLALIALMGRPAFSFGFSAIIDEAKTPITVILVRHAEKKVVPPENKDPDLSLAGLARAQELARIFGDTGIAAIYATQYKRTQQTVKPLAGKLGLTVSKVEAKKTAELVKEIRSRNTGQVIFIAGHNNTVPEIIAALGGPQLPIIPEEEFDNLYILTVLSDGSAKLLKMKYGNSQPTMGQGMMSPP